jgi:hypothetical protein
VELVSDVPATSGLEISEFREVLEAIADGGSSAFLALFLGLLAGLFEKPGRTKRRMSNSSPAPRMMNRNMNSCLQEELDQNGTGMF